MQRGEVPVTFSALAFTLIVKTLFEETGLLHPELTVYVIVAVPALIAVTSPDAAFTVATAVLLLLQLPPASPLLVYVVVAPIQSGVVPVTVPALALGLTVNDLDALNGLLHPVLTV